jgi:Ca2+-binding RTX toxin-like protein
VVNDKVVFDKLIDNMENVKITDDAKGDITVYGNTLANGMTGHIGVNLFYGGDGNDTISGADGNDRLYGESGDDTVKGDAGNDTVGGGAGNDTLYGGTGADMVYGGIGNDRLDGDADNDMLYGEGGDDVMRGGLGDDYLSGGDGIDVVYGGEGLDRLYGGAHNDTLSGENGNDRLFGGAGSDWLFGGAGSDAFVFLATTDSVASTGIDRIQDFSSRSGDLIDLSSIDASTSLLGNQAFAWAGMAQPEVAKAGNLWGQAFNAVGTTPGYVRLFGDVNGDGTADFQVDVLNVTALSAVDFVL